MTKFSKEDKVAKQLIEAVDSLTLDLEKVGRTIAWSSNNLTLNRLQVILESAEEEKGALYVRYDTIRK